MFISIYGFFCYCEYYFNLFYLYCVFDVIVFYNIKGKGGDID